MRRWSGMEILREIQNNEQRTAVALGYFDGVHLGHQAVLRKACALAREYGAAPAALTFDMRAHRAQAKGKGDLDSYEHRAQRIEEMGIRMLVQLDFAAVSEMSPETFVRTVLGKEGINAAAVCCGADFRFGRGRAGDVTLLRSLGERYGFVVQVVPEVLFDGTPVSTSRIKECAARGEIEQAAALLGHPYSFSLTVCEDKKLARRLGFPTINQRFPQELLAPRFGVYQSRVELFGKSYDGISNIGVRPSVGNDREIMLETHIIDYSGDLYGRMVTVELVRFMRDEKKFDSVEALREQVVSDIETVRRRTGSK